MLLGFCVFDFYLKRLFIVIEVVELVVFEVDFNGDRFIVGVVVEFGRYLVVFVCFENIGVEGFLLFGFQFLQVVGFDFQL